MFWKRSSPLVGLDIGSYAVKAVLLTKKNDKLLLNKVESVRTPSGAIVDHDVKNFEVLGKSITPLVLRVGNKHTDVVAAVSGPSVITKEIKMPITGSEANLEAQIQIEADQLIPFPIDDVSLDFEVLNINSNNQATILLSVCHTEQVETRVAAIKIAGYTPKIMDIAAHALGRTLQYMQPLFDEPINEQPIAMVDIGANTMLLVIVLNNQIVYSKEIKFGGDTFNQAVSDYYSMDLDLVEAAKLSDSLPIDYLIDVLPSFQTLLIQQIRRNLQIFSTSNQGLKIKHLVLSGGGIKLTDTVNVLRDELSLNIVVANPFISMEFDAGINKEKILNEAHLYTLAVGLSLRGVI